MRVCIQHLVALNPQFANASKFKPSFIFLFLAVILSDVHWEGPKIFSNSCCGCGEINKDVFPSKDTSQLSGM